MALSDTCSEALNTLQDDLINYSDCDYKAEELNCIFKSMYELASFIIINDFPFDEYENKREIFIGNLIIYGLLNRTTAENVDKILIMIAKVSKINELLHSKISKILNYTIENKNSNNAKECDIFISQLTWILNY
jgi:hypothetical protein